LNTCASNLPSQLHSEKLAGEVRFQAFVQLALGNSINMKTALAVYQILETNVASGIEDGVQRICVVFGINVAVQIGSRLD